MIDRVGMIGLLKIELPDATIRLCDGGFVPWGAETFRSVDPVFGSLAAVEELEEGIAESVPAFTMTLLPTGAEGPAALSQPGFQRSRVRFWLAEYAPDDGMLVGEPDLQFDGQIDTTTLSAGFGELSLDMSVVSQLERLFSRNRGNSLNPRWHKSVWPGETGHDNATGLSVPVAWGVESQGGGNGSSVGGPGSLPGVVDPRGGAGRQGF